jgi:hypothetical protein
MGTINDDAIEAVIDSAMWYLSQGRHRIAQRRLYIVLLQDGANTWKADHLATRAVDLWKEWEEILEREDDLYESYGKHKIRVETDLAIAVENEFGDLQWFPRSVVRDSGSMGIGEEHELEVKRWFLEKEGLV